MDALNALTAELTREALEHVRKAGPVPMLIATLAGLAIALAVVYIKSDNGEKK